MESGNESFGAARPHDESPQDNPDRFFDAREDDSSGSEEEKTSNGAVDKGLGSRVSEKRPESVDFKIGGDNECEDEQTGNYCSQIMETISQRQIKSMATSSPIGNDLSGINGKVSKMVIDSRNVETNIVSKINTQRSVNDCLEIYKRESVAQSLTDDEIISLVKHKHIPAYQLEKAVGDMERGVSIR